jgi:hypothetical protein
MHDEIIRFDVVEIYIEKNQDNINLKEIKLIKNAF